MLTPDYNPAFAQSNPVLPMQMEEKQWAGQDVCFS